MFEGKTEKKELMNILGADSFKVQSFDDVITPESIAFPLADIAAFGAAFSSLAGIIAAVGQSAGNGKLYRAVFPTPGVLAQKDGMNLGAIVRKGEGVVGQARFQEVPGAAANAAGSAATMCMAIAIMAINHSLKNISENQKSIISFLETDKQTQLKGDLLILSDIINEYQYNWDNAQFRSNREMQVLDIKRSAEQSILFYREMIEKKLNKQTFIHMETSKTLNDIQSKFKYYKLALYSYSFSSFIDIMLLENFDSHYLNSIVDKINKYSLDYDAFYKKSLEGIEKYVKTSVQARALSGLSIAGGFLGKQIAKIPDKENKIKIDDKLISGSEKLDDFQKKSIDKTVESFTSVEDGGIKLFTDKILFLNKLYNEPVEIMFDEKNIYLSADYNAA